MTKKQKPAPSQLINKMAGKYDGAELRPYCGRPGAMDAFSKPSRIGDNFTPHKYPSGMTSSAVSAGYERWELLNYDR